MVIRPSGLVLNGNLELGLELLLDDGKIAEIRPQTGMPDPFVASVPFVNAHSHLEYRGLQGEIHETEYWPWIRELTRRKALQTLEEVAEDCRAAATENRATGVGLIGEHTDRPGAMAALREAGILVAGFQELITFNEQLDPAEKRAATESKKVANEAILGETMHWALHAPYTVDEATLREFADLKDRISIHVAETEDENLFFLHGSGRIADFYAAHGFAPRKADRTAVGYLHALGLLRPGVQLVHGCAMSTEDIALLKGSGVSLAHCPRSNEHLGCPKASIKSVLAAGVPVGIGLDSPASSGPIDMFAEMRMALHVAHHGPGTLTPETVWRMATSMGAQSLGVEGWDLREGWSGPILAIDLGFAHTIEEMIEHGTPEHVRWINLNPTQG